MFTAKLTNKRELENGQLEVTVEYTDGTDTHTETFVPQDKQGYIYRTLQVAESLTTAKELKTEDNVGKVIEKKEVTVPKAEQDKNDWFAAYNRLTTLETIAEKAFLTGTKAKVLTDKITEVKTYLNANIKVEYLDVI